MMAFCYTFIEQLTPFTVHGTKHHFTKAFQGALELGPLLFPKPATTLTKRLLY